MNVPKAGTATNPANPPAAIIADDVSVQAGGAPRNNPTVAAGEAIHEAVDIPATAAVNIQHYIRAVNRIDRQDMRHALIDDGVLEFQRAKDLVAG